MNDTVLWIHAGKQFGEKYGSRPPGRKNKSYFLPIQNGPGVTMLHDRILVDSGYSDAVVMSMTADSNDAIDRRLHMAMMARSRCHAATG